MTANVVCSARAVRFFRATYFLPYGVPGVIALILWGFLYTPGTSPILALLGHAGWHPNLLGGTTCSGRSPTSSPGSSPATTC